jgi:3-hydroxyacyl-[acyl-carrier-protein] dehydratase
MTDPIIFDAIPHREPFLFIDEIVRWDESEIVCKKTFTGEEFFFAGHYPHYPLTPGVILCEAAMQAGAIFLSKFFKETHDQCHQRNNPAEKVVPVVGRMNDVKFRQRVRPGDEVVLHVTLTERLQDVFFMKAKVTTGSKIAATFHFACKMITESEQKNG